RGSGYVHTYENQKAREDRCARRASKHDETGGMLLVVVHGLSDGVAPVRIAHHVEPDPDPALLAQWLEQHDRCSPRLGRRGKYRNGHALLAGDFALDERFIAGLHEPQKADSTQTRKVRVHVQRIEECSEFSRLDLSTAGMKQGLRRAQQRKMKIDPAFNPVQRVVRRGRKLYA